VGRWLRGRREPEVPFVAGIGTREWLHIGWCPHGVDPVEHLGVGEIQDFMPVRGAAEARRHRLIRRVMCVRGT
jgi:hypothetical protein